MPAEIRVPILGESVVEATVGRWLKKEGDAVTVGEPLVELETEKVNVEVAAETTGTLAQVLHAEGATVKPGEVLGTVEAGPPAQEAPAETPAEAAPDAAQGNGAG